MREMTINKEQRAIIEHAIKNQFYNGDSEDMDALCDAGLMQFAGRKSFVPGGYYRATAAGKKALRRPAKLKGIIVTTNEELGEVTILFAFGNGWQEERAFPINGNRADWCQALHVFAEQIGHAEAIDM